MKQSRAFWIWIAVLASGLVLLAVAFWLDPMVEVWVNHHQVRWLRKLTRLVNVWGDWPPLLAAGLLGAGSAWLCGSRKWTQIILSMLIACALSAAFTKPLQYCVVRVRPIVKIEDKPMTPSRYRSFPSGHAAFSAAFFVTLAIANWRMGAPLLALPLLIAFSRVYVSAHYLSDVLAGAMIGTLAAIFVWRWIIPKLSESRAAEN